MLSVSLSIASVHTGLWVSAFGQFSLGRILHRHAEVWMLSHCNTLILLNFQVICCRFAEVVGITVMLIHFFGQAVVVGQIKVLR